MNYSGAADVHDVRPDCPYREKDPGAADAHDALALSAHTVNYSGAADAHDVRPERPYREFFRGS